MLNLQMLLKNTLLPWSIRAEISVGAALLMEDVPSKVQTLLQKASRWVAMLVQKSLSQPAFRKMISYSSQALLLTTCRSNWTCYLADYSSKNEKTVLLKSVSGCSFR